MGPKGIAFELSKSSTVFYRFDKGRTRFSQGFGAGRMYAGGTFTVWGFGRLEHYPKHPENVDPEPQT